MDSAGTTYCKQEWSSGTAVVDRSNPFFNLFNQVHDVINNHLNGPKEDESVVTGVKKHLRDTITDLYNHHFRTFQEVADALPSHSIILATRFINPFSGAIASITRYLGILSHSHLLQIQATALTVAGSLHSLTAPSAAADDEIHSLTQDFKAATERISELEANMNDIVDRTTVKVLAANPGTRIQKPPGSRARLSSGRGR
ncbi:hypothetical protein QQZ08_010796 [Neonectria magnoliae]|uniref:Uncharacterized protein n=1 Tax=Neonectria magnoliae TaxID=2732573 RepID=A0ABR1HFP6_9HYPO